jgi:hypothetical protein
MNLAKVVQSSFSRLFGLGPELVRAATYYRPASFAPSTGLTASAEVTAACSAFIASFRPQELGTVTIQPGDEKVFIRASELSGISDPSPGDYLVESANSLRRDVLHPPQLDPSGSLWTLHCARSLNQDWGDLAVFTDSEDRGDLALATSSDDFGALT